MYVELFSLIASLATSSPEVYPLCSTVSEEALFLRGAHLGRAKEMGYTIHSCIEGGKVRNYVFPTEANRTELTLGGNTGG